MVQCACSFGLVVSTCHFRGVAVVHKRLDREKQNGSPPRLRPAGCRRAGTLSLALCSAVFLSLFIALFGLSFVAWTFAFVFSRDWLAHSRSVLTVGQGVLLTVAEPPFLYSMEAGIVGTVANTVVRLSCLLAYADRNTGRHRQAQAWA